MARPDQWTPEQEARRNDLLEMLPQRPWWVMVCPPKVPKHCEASPGLVMRCDHTSWRRLFPPCRKGCVCVVWALTPLEAREVNRKVSGAPDQLT